MKIYPKNNPGLILKCFNVGKFGPDVATFKVFKTTIAAKAVCKSLLVVAFVEKSCGAGCGGVVDVCVPFRGSKKGEE